jgi:type III pantothenate kinase
VSIRLAVDIGNSATKFALFDDDRFLELADTLEGLKAITRVRHVSVASVVPEKTDAVRAALEAVLTQTRIRVITHAHVPLTNLYLKPKELGVDRLLAAYGARELFAKELATITITAGTATTYNCVTRNGEYLGGAIAPGLELRSFALNTKTAQLPAVSLDFPPSVLGRTTYDGLRSGIMLGALAEIEGMIAMLKDEVFPTEDVVVVATGGHARLLQTRTSVFDHVDELLTVKAINRIISSQRYDEE